MTYCIDKAMNVTMRSAKNRDWTIQTCVVILIMLTVIRHAQSQEVVEQKCLRPNRAGCKIHHRRMQLWCDDMNITHIPDPDTIPIIGRKEVHLNLSEELFLNQSCLTRVDADVLKKFVLLVTLDLCGNKIKKVERNWFNGLPRLQVLLMAGNGILHIHSHAFHGLDNLDTLHLGNNMIKNLKENTFEGIGTVRVLKLNNNMLETISEEAFRYMTNLEVLDVSGNNIKVFTEWHLSGLGNLRTLNLQENNLQEFAVENFATNRALKEIDLSNNSIECLEPDVFDKTELSAIILVGNPLKTAKPSWFRNMVKTNDREQFSEGGKPLTTDGGWVCDCNIILYQTFLKQELSQEEWWSSILDIRCDSPLGLKGRMLSSTTPEELGTNCTRYLEEEPECGSRQRRDRGKDKVQRPKTTTTTTTQRTTADGQVVSITTQPAPSAPQSTIVRITTTTTIHPAIPAKASFTWGNEHWYVVAGLGAIILFLILVIALCKRRTTTNKPRDPEGGDQPRKNSQAASSPLRDNGFATDQSDNQRHSRTDSIVSSYRGPSSHFYDPVPAIEDERQSASGRSFHSTGSIAAQTNPKTIIGSSANDLQQSCPARCSCLPHLPIIHAPNSQSILGENCPIYTSIHSQESGMPCNCQPCHCHPTATHVAIIPGYITQPRITDSVGQS